jgi:predicted metalloprotease with PDZ domain
MLILLLVALLAAPQATSQPGWTPPARAEIPVRDVAYPGTIVLDVDARRSSQRILSAREVIPVAAAGTLTLRYPQWLQANHAPTGAVGSFANLRFAAGGKPLAWRRDPVDMYAFHVDVPAGVRSIEAMFDVVGTGAGRAFATPDLLGLQWERVLLYPAGHFARRIAIRPSVHLPEGMTGVSALDGEPRSGRVAYSETDVETLVDSPMFAGRHFKAWPLRRGVDLDVVAERPEDLAATPEQIETHARIVDQVDRLMGRVRHFDHYDFLLALQEDGFGGGVEHHRSSENGSVRGYFTDWASTPTLRGLLPHEYFHSWNGKFRRPAATWRPDFHVPIENELLWVYEGQTSYWDIVLGARSGMVPRDVALGELASHAAGYEVQAGRAWRPLADTVNQPIIAYGAAQPYPSAQRGVDYYNESALIWLDADTLIRQRSGGKRSLDDFARSFFGIRDGDRGVVTYRFDDVVAALNAVEPYDWASFLRDRIDRPGAPAPMGGIERGGYRLVFRDTPNPYDKANMGLRRYLDLTHSLGGRVSAAGVLTDVRWGGPLFAAGLAGGATIAAVDGEAYSDEAIKAAITRAKTAKAPIRLLVREGKRVREVAIDYRDGLRWPWLEKPAAGEALLDRALAPL